MQRIVIRSHTNTNIPNAENRVPRVMAYIGLPNVDVHDNIGKPPLLSQSRDSGAYVLHLTLTPNRTRHPITLKPTFITCHTRCHCHSSFPKGWDALG